ncbi:MAG: PAS domain-containing protein [Opitutaceae bacterium]|nr:PAS domain-containing protein [Opitutaceae bacterium]
MSWVTIIWSMVAATCLTLAVLRLIEWSRRREVWGNLILAIATTGIAGMGFCELTMMRTGTAEQFHAVVRWIHLPAWVVFVALIAFVRVQLRAGSRWLALAACGVWTLSLVINFLVEPNVNYLEVSPLVAVPFLGESISFSYGDPNPWMVVGELGLLLMIAFLVGAVLEIWRRGERGPILVVGAGILAGVLLVSIHGILVLLRVCPAPLIMSFYYMIVVAAMACQISHEAREAALLTQSLQKKGEWLDLTADSAGVGLWSWAFKTDLISATDRARDLHGYSGGDPVSFQKFIATLHPDDSEWVLNEARRCLREGVDFRHDYRVVTRERGTRWLRVLGKPFLTPAGAPGRMTGVSIDITDRKQAELEIGAQRKELAHLSRVTILGELSGSIAHELNQPLAAILSNSQVGHRSLDTANPDLKEMAAILADIAADAKRAGGIIHGMRAMFKKDVPPTMQPVDLNETITDVINLLHGELVAQKARVDIRLAEALPPVIAGRVEIQQVVINLVLNSLDAVKTRGVPGRIEVSTECEKGRVIVSVHDNGPGIPAEMMERLFEPFTSSKPSGLGLGLTISRRIADRFGAQLIAENHPEGGAVFRMIFSRETP